MHQEPPSSSFHSLPPTRTVMVSGFADRSELESFRRENFENENVRDVYSPDSSNVLFALFYDLREAKNTVEKKHANHPKLRLSYTISRYEIPKRGDDCKDKNFQSSLHLFFKNTNGPIEDDKLLSFLSEIGEVKEIRNSKPFQKTVEFYDRRSAEKALEQLGNRPYDGGIIRVRWVWDLSFSVRNEYLRRTESVVSGYAALDEVAESEVKRQRPEAASQKNVLLRVFDECIVESLSEIERIMRRI